MSETMKDVCYGCGKVEDYGTMHEVNEGDFDILCDKCFREQLDGYIENIDARKNAFWRGRNEFHAVEGCKRCNGESEEEFYVCIDHEKEQLETKGY